MNNPATSVDPFVAWTWHNGKGGLLRTQVFANGQIRQQRQHDPDDVVTEHDLGIIPAAQAATFLARCRAALSAAPAISMQTTPAGESYELTLAENENQEVSRQVARTALNSDATMETMRREILAARSQVFRRWNMWSSAGARWFYLTVAVTVALGVYIVTDMKHDDQLQARAQKVAGTVIEQGGTPFKSEFLRVKLDGPSAGSDVRISKYLSHPHWEAAKTGSKVDVLYDDQSKQAWLTSDLLRWQQDKKTIWMIPGFLLLMALVGLAWLRRYEIGAYGDGQEYMIHEDRVVTDDRDAAISRSALLWFKMFV